MVAGLQIVMMERLRNFLRDGSKSVPRQTFEPHFVRFRTEPPRVTSTGFFFIFFFVLRLRGEIFWDFRL